jgi:hypothetical protein
MTALYCEMQVATINKSKEMRFAPKKKRVKERNGEICHGPYLLHAMADQANKFL